MGDAINYHGWILDIFKPFLGNYVVEVGAGQGSFSERILGRHACRTLSLVEPSEQMYRRLVARVQQMKSDAHVQSFQGTLPAIIPLIHVREAPDSIIYVNVLEHIADDEAELNIVHDALSSGSRVLIFVPAFSWLYGRFDKRVGHFRRYTRDELEEKLRRARFEILHSAYFDLTGIIP